MARFERFSLPPRALSPQYKHVQSNRLTAFDHQRIAMQRLKMEENARIKNEQELHDDLFNFNHILEVDDYGFPLQTSYEIENSVPPVYVAPSFEEKKNSVKTENDNHSQSGTE